MVLRKSSLYNCKTIVLEDSGFRKINEEWMQKLGPKKVCGIDRKRKQNEAKMGARNRQ